jgi:DNA replication protein DnaC
VSWRCPYEQCDGDGLLVDEETNTAYNCRCRPQLIAHAKARNLAQVIPKRYRSVSFDTPPLTDIEPRRVVDDTRRFANTIDAQLDAGRGLWFMGPVGTGKTSLAMLISKAALAAGRSVGIYSLPGLLWKLGRSYEIAGGHEDLIDALTTVDLLHIDDIGAERTNEWVLESLYTIINARYEDQRSVVITTNILERDALCEQISARTVSRLTEMCDELPVLGRDRRMDLRSA